MGEAEGPRRAKPRTSESVVMARILAAFADGYEVSLAPRELSRRTGLNPGTIHRALAVMVDERLLTMADGNYYLGPVLEQIGIATRRRTPEARTLELMTRLRDETNETVALTELRAGVKVCVLQVESREELRTRTPVGVPLPVTGTVSDFLFFAHAVEGTLGDEPIDELEDLSTVQLEDLRKSRVCVTQGRAAGTLAVGSLLDPEPDGVLRVLSVVGPEARMRLRGAKHYVSRTRAAVSDLAAARRM